MKKKVILELAGVIFVLALILSLTVKFYSAKNDPDLGLLAIGIVLTAFLGGYNMFKSLFESAEVKALKEANRLNDRKIGLLEKQMKVGRVIEMINNFIQPLIWDFEEKIDKIDKSLSGQGQQSALIIKINDEYAHKDILGEKYEWIEEKADEYNKLIGDVRLEEAQGLLSDFKNKLEELEKGYMVDYEIPRDKIKEKVKSLRGII